MPKGQRNDGRPMGRPAVMNVVVVDVPFSVKANTNMMVSWTCPKCGHRNEKQWFYGRADHVCLECEEWTNIKGEVHPVLVVSGPM